MTLGQILTIVGLWIALGLAVAYVLGGAGRIGKGRRK